MKETSRRYYYPLRNPDRPNEVSLVEISESEYHALYPEIWRTQKRERALGRCLCPRSHIWVCDADCLVCPWHTAGEIWSLDRDQEILGDRDSGAPDPADIVADRMILQRLLQRLEELCPGAYRVGELRLDGLSERSALEDSGVSRTTYRSRLKKAEEILRDEFGDIF